MTGTTLNYLSNSPLVFGVFFRHYLKTGEKFIGTSAVLPELRATELSDEEVAESLEILSSRSYLRIKRAGETIYLVEMFPHLYAEMMRLEIPEYDEKVVTIISKIVNEDCHSSQELKDKTGFSTPVILQILSWLQNKGLVTTISPMGIPVCQITQVSAELKRILRQSQLR